MADGRERDNGVSDADEAAREPARWRNDWRQRWRMIRILHFLFSQDHLDQKHQHLFDVKIWDFCEFTKIVQSLSEVLK